MSQTQATFEEVIRAWILDCDGRVPTEKRQRQESFLVLLGNLAKYGYDKEELTTSKKEKIVRSCVNPNYRHKQKLKTWIAMVVSDLEDAILIYYGQVKIDRDVITPEMSSKLDGLSKKAEETRLLRSADDSEKDSESGDEGLDIEGEVKNAINNPHNITEENFEITDEMLGNSVGPEVVWDENFMDKIESDDER
jgi:hypothetical protein